jgi:hypothetical protein
MITVADIKGDLPTWPEAIIEEWLLYFANEPDGGWPPPDPLGNHRWNRLLGGRPLSWWRRVSWSRQKANCDLESFSPKAKQGVAEIMAAISAGTADQVTKRRFDHPFKYIMDNGVFPGAVILMGTPRGFDILDGSHRMAAFVALQMCPDETFSKLKKNKASVDQEVWIAKHEGGELPL